MKLTDIQYNKLKDLLNSKLSNPKEYEELKETAPKEFIKQRDMLVVIIK